ncbi:hypothetical protein ACGF7U_10185 [Micromonospora sp. NPDC047670]|uniref:hypothetical protein n=1 Tax=Micromonospora sp. NPDC047670 TaxID=3364252 RepID=UPI0037184D77
MDAPVELRWPTAADGQLRADVHRVLHAVAERGGAIGCPDPTGQARGWAWR